MRGVVFFIVFFCVIFSSIDCFAQETIFDEARTVYSRETTFGAHIHTSGWGINYRRGKFVDGFSKRVYELELSGIKHEKQIKSYNPFFDNTKGYYYGKLNVLMVLRGGLSKHKAIVNKQSVKGIAIDWIYQGGVTLGYLKPVHLDIIKRYSEGNIIQDVERYNPATHTVDNILGRGPFLTGFFDGSLEPGIHGKTSLLFESSVVPDRVNALEVGATLDVFLRELPLMAFVSKQRIYLNVYVALHFGKKKFG